MFSLHVSVYPPSLHLCFSPPLFICPSSSFLSVSVCMCGVFLSLPGRSWLQSDFSRLHSQAKHQNTQHWWVTESKLLTIARCWSIFGKAWFVYQSLWKDTSHLLVFFYSMVGKRKSTDHSWLMSKTFIFCPWELCNMGKTMNTVTWFSSNYIHLNSHKYTVFTVYAVFTPFTVFTGICRRKQTCM